MFQKTLELLNAFRNRLFQAKTSNEEDSQNNLEDVGNKEESSETLSESDPLKAIFNHRLELDEEIKVSSFYYKYDSFKFQKKNLILRLAKGHRRKYSR